MIFVGGVSGAGKTTVVSRFASSHLDYTHIRASQILVNSGRKIQNINVSDFDENQVIIRNYLSTLDRKKVILDGHGIIPFQSGIYFIAPEFFRILDTQAIFLIQTCPEIIAFRKSTSGIHADINNIKDLQYGEEKWLAYIASHIKKPIFKVQTYESFQDTLLKL